MLPSCSLRLAPREIGATTCCEPVNKVEEADEEDDDEDDEDEKEDEVGGEDKVVADEL